MPPGGIPDLPHDSDLEDFLRRSSDIPGRSDVQSVERGSQKASLETVNRRERRWQRNHHIKVTTSFNLGDRVPIKDLAGQVGRIAELRGPLGPGGEAGLSRPTSGEKPTVSYIELLGDQLEYLPMTSQVVVVKRDNASPKVADSEEGRLNLLAYQKAVDFADQVCDRTEQFDRGYGFLALQLTPRGPFALGQYRRRRWPLCQGRPTQLLWNRPRLRAGMCPVPRTGPAQTVSSCHRRTHGARGRVFEEIATMLSGLINGLDKREG